KGLGHMIFFGLCSTFGKYGGLETASHKRIQTIPSTPLRRKAVLQPNRSAIGMTIKGVTSAPMVPPLKEVAIPRARRFEGSDSTAVRNPPGNVAPSPKPS